ncbi:MAG: LysM peptidoglycan-binding domain-containing protein [bacterium]
MRRYFLTLIFTFLFILTLEPTRDLFSKFFRLDEPTVHEIHSGEWLSKLAATYYGDASYWKELALVNRAPDGNRIFPGEHVIIPSFEIIREIRRAGRLSQVNDLVKGQLDVLEGLASRDDERVPVNQVTGGAPVGESLSQAPALPNESKHPGPVAQSAKLQTESSPITLILLVGVVALCVLLIGSALYFLRKRRREDIEYYGKTTVDEGQDEDHATGNLFLQGFAAEPGEIDSTNERKQIELT